MHQEVDSILNELIGTKLTLNYVKKNDNHFKVIYDSFKTFKIVIN